MIESKKHCVKIKATWMKTKQYIDVANYCQSKGRSMIPVTVGWMQVFFQKIRKNWSLRSARLNGDLSRTSTLQNETIIFCQFVKCLLSFKTCKITSLNCVLFHDHLKL